MTQRDESGRQHPGPQPLTKSERADRLKESIYLIFAALAVTLALRGHGDVEAGDALVTLAVTLAGTVLAVFTADVIAHVVVHGELMSRGELVHAMRTSFGALPAVALPFVLLGVSALTRWDVNAALLASAVALAFALVALAWVAVRRVTLRWWERLVVLGIETALAMAVIALQLLAHA
ncbi:MAG: hypothetical protein QM611_02980 [Microbacterium sp.]|uniref:hypothetical protein n=1 Tax=Microbacterium sp. TaxID=51671 RepID=UPI0039E3972D